MDSFLEEVVVKKNKNLQTLLLAGANILWVALGFWALVILESLISVIFSSGFNAGYLIPIAQVIIFGGVAALLFLYRDRIRTEYEYTFTNGQMDFAQVFNNKKRKALGTMNVRNVEACGLVSSGSFQRYISMPDLKRTNWFLNRDSELLYFYFQKNGQKRIIIIEPSEEMVANIRKYLPQGAWQNN